MMSLSPIYITFLRSKVEIASAGQATPWELAEKESRVILTAKENLKGEKKLEELRIRLPCYKRGLM